MNLLAEFSTPWFIPIRRHNNYHGIDSSQTVRTVTTKPLFIEWTSWELTNGINYNLIHNIEFKTLL